MANSSSSSRESATLVNPTNTEYPILSINMNSVTKLTSDNYITWSLQVSYFLDGHDLQQFISESFVPPLPTIKDGGFPRTNPKFTQWKKQDKLIFVALLGSITTALQPLISCATTTHETWKILAETYDNPSRGHMKQIKDQLKKSTKGQRTIDEYMQLMKTKADQLALLGKPLDHEDVIEYILDGLDNDYKLVIDQINGRDKPPTFAELHEKLVNCEATILCAQPHMTFPAPANTTYHNKGAPRNNQRSFQPRNNGPRTNKPYLGKCQACGVQGHNANRCPQFRIVSKNSASYAGLMPLPFQSRANQATLMIPKIRSC